MFFAEKYSGESLPIQWIHPSKDFKFFEIFDSIPKSGSHEFLLGFKQWEKLSFGASAPNKNTIAKIPFK